jgi:hypothetical protein
MENYWPKYAKIMRIDINNNMELNKNIFLNENTILSNEN